ncbi:hypothetical protein SCP_0205850 [Sparassis crispa]|uniref:Cytochrome P450 n=1 Tax=Sparassis crispa TaxID=139825 RepID=A0A401GB57_9APHY|nr:hypothetical protein SCP_0205850 [Sparassis crispa]GBE79387.1 hypothetical protein SCP_0205850 [Sparassis crispa]
MLEKKRAIYSDRPTLTVGGDMAGWDRVQALLQTGPEWREHRLLFSLFIGSRSKIAQLHILRSVGASILRLSHGCTAEEDVDYFLQFAESALAEFSYLTGGGPFLADAIPWLRYITEWMPGAEWRRNVKIWAKHRRDMQDLPYRFVQGQVAAGPALPSLLSLRLQEENLTSEQEEVAKFIATSFFVGGTDSTAAARYKQLLLDYDVLAKSAAEGPDGNRQCDWERQTPRDRRQVPAALPQCSMLGDLPVKSCHFTSLPLSQPG